MRRILLLCCSCLYLTSLVARAAEQRPNVVILLADDLGSKDIGCYGGPVKTPALDELLASLPEPDLPADLARRVLACLARPRAEGGLDALLERAPAPEVPSGLAGRVLTGLGDARREAALDRLPEVGPDLVIADVHMPGADGYEVCRQLKANPETADSAVIFLSALDDTGDGDAGGDYLGGIEGRGPVEAFLEGAAYR